MTMQAKPEGQPKAPTSERVRIAAAQLRRDVDKRQNKPTPEWILELAAKDPAAN